MSYSYLISYCFLIDVKCTIYSMFKKTSVDLFILELRDELTVLLLLLLYALQFILLFC